MHNTSGIPGSPAPLIMPPRQDERGPKYGQQAKYNWGIGQTSKEVLAECLRADSLWRVTVRGHNVLISLTYGTSGTRELVGLLTPLVLYVPGQFNLYAEPEGLDGQTAEAIVTVTPATNAGVAQARRLVAGPNLALRRDAVRYVALADSVVSIHGGTVSVPVPALSSVSLVAGSTLTSGTGYEEFET